jgi:ATP adenylyltransferase
MRNTGKDLQTACPFCDESIESRIIAREGTVFAIRDKYPVTNLHTLILPRRHVSDYFDLTQEEKADTDRLLVFMRNTILEEDPSVTGFNVGVNCGVSAGQTIRHAHIHMIPRREGDIPNPRGGVRGVIPAKMDYPNACEEGVPKDTKN